MGQDYSLIDILGDPLELREWQNKGLPTDTISADNSIFATQSYRWPFMIDPQNQANTWIKNVWGKEREINDDLSEDNQEDSDEYAWKEDSVEHGGEVSLDLIVLKMDMEEKMFNNKLKNALMNGNPVLIEDFGENLEPMLDPVINKQWYTNTADRRTLLKFNEEIIDFNPEFRIFLTTKVANPNFLPDVFIRTNIINFTVTKKGLEDQLLG